MRGNTTYVTYTSDGLPLTNLIRDVVPFGNAIADRTQPVLTNIVNSASPNGNPIPADPSKYQPATPFSSLTQLAASAATARSASKATSTTAVMADDAKTSGTAAVTPSKKRMPLTNVLRLGGKATPPSRTDAGRPSHTSDPVATIEKSTKDEQHDAEPTKPGNSTESKENAAGAAEGDAS